MNYEQGVTKQGIPPIFQENEIYFVSGETGHSNLDTWTHLVHSPCILSLLFVGHFHMKVFHGKDSKSCPGACKSFQCMLAQSPSSASSKYLHVSSFPQNICFFCNVGEIWEYQLDRFDEIWQNKGLGLRFLKRFLGLGC